MYYGYWKSSIFGNNKYCDNTELFNCNDRKALQAYAKAKSKSGDIIVIFEMATGLITDYYFNFFTRFIEIEDCEFAKNHAPTEICLKAINETRELK